MPGQGTVLALPAVTLTATGGTLEMLGLQWSGKLPVTPFPLTAWVLIELDIVLLATVTSLLSFTNLMLCWSGSRLIGSATATGLLGTIGRLENEVLIVIVVGEDEDW